MTRSVQMRTAIICAEAAKMAGRIQQVQLDALENAIKAAFAGETFKLKLPDDEYDLSFGAFEPEVSDRLLKNLDLKHADFIEILPPALESITKDFATRTKAIRAAPLPTIEIPSVEELRDKYSKPIIE